MFASSYSCFLRNPALVVKVWKLKKEFIVSLCMPRVCMCVPRHMPSHTCASRWSVHGHVYGKGEWQVGFGFAWHQEKLYKFFFTSNQWRKTPASPCYVMALPKEQAAKGPAFSSTQLGSTETLAITDVQVIALCWAPRASCASLGCGVCGAVTLRAL